MSKQLYDERGRIQEKRWYAAAVTTGREKVVRDRISKLTKSERFGELITDVLIPSYKELNAKGKEIEKLIYTQYVYIYMVLNDETWHALNLIDGFRTFLPADDPQPLTELEMRKIFKMVGRTIEKQTSTSINFNEGDKVEIIEGTDTPFGNLVTEKLEGEIIEVNDVKQEALVLVQMGEMGTKIRIGLDKLKKL